ncbi:MAG: chemotaxis protein CheW [Sedimentisphaerales bacterium]|nr:chemotaxis protein CheW [Sedimentisphaerales bacterium]
MANENDELIASFVEEASEVLADVENDFLAIEEAGENIDHELVNKVFRGVHSMKGSAGFLGLTSIGTLAHESENVLNLIRNNELIPTPDVVNALLRSADTLRGMVNNINSSNDVDVSEHINELKQTVAGETSPEVQESLTRDVDIVLPEGGLAFVMIKEMELVSRQRMGHHIYVLDVDLFADVQAHDLTPLDFLKNAYQHGELIDSYISTVGLGDLSADLPDAMSFMMIFASKLSQEELADQLRMPLDRVYHIATSEQTSWKPTGPEVPSDTASQKPQAKVSSPTKKTTSSASAQTSLRVSVKVLDTLMNLAGELVLGRNQLLQEAESKDHRGIESVAARIDQVTSELQEAIMQTRMQPIGTVFNKFPRIVRDLSSSLDKRCELTIEGKNVEMDKAIIEGIGDPLTHLIRNSVDHGIEQPDVRTANGKNAVGTVILKAYHQAGKVNIAIIDDGDGINHIKLKEKAVEKGVITAEQAAEMSEREAVRLIFHPGFSMAKKVTGVSGRGVGMDVVRTNIEKLGGTVDIETKVGKGTTISIKLPLTLAIIPSMVVRCGNGRFALPQTGISELVRIKASEVAEKIERLREAEVLRLRGSLLPLVRLSDVLNIQSKYRELTTQQLMDNNRLNITDCRSKEHEEHTEQENCDIQRRDDTVAGATKIIVVETGNLRYGLIVDELFDSKEIVVKPLGRHMKGNPCLAGATILGDGNVALILDVAGIAAHLQLTMPDADNTKNSQELTSGDKAETQSVLIFNNDPSEHFAVPTNFISRIERIRSEQIDSVAGREVLQYRGSSLPLLSLEQHIKAQPRPDTTWLYVVVFKLSGFEVGLVAPELVDISNISIDIDTITFRETGVVGSIVLDDKTIRLIDVYELAEAAHPEWFTQQEETASAVREQKTTTILLAEDSTFFRQQMKNFIEAEGYEVIACEDGQIAWETLQLKDPDQNFDMVVTDIEMPNLDGLHLARNIKADPELAHLPIIAVTSLAGEDDMQRGYEAGVDDYQIKLDREKLLAAIARYLKTAKVENAK